MAFQYFNIFVVDNSTSEVDHTFYASNTTGSRTNRTLLYSGNITGMTDIRIGNIFRYLIYELSIKDESKVDVCELGIVGEFCIEQENQFKIMLVNLENVLCIDTPK